MASPVRNFAEGAALFAVGLLLRLFTEDVHVPVLTLTTVGNVLMVVGGLEILHGVYRTVNGKARRSDP